LGCWLDSSVQIPDIEIAPFGGRCWFSVFILAFEWQSWVPPPSRQFNLYNLNFN